MNNKISVLVCCHKPDLHIKNEGIYKAIQVGKSLHPEIDLGFLNDNTGDNISEKNPSWCELTALYWGWKNLNSTEYKGLCHYRRYFGINISKDNIDSIIAGFDMITIKQTNKMLSRSERPINLIKMTSYEDYYLFMDTLLDLLPNHRAEIIDYYYNSRLSVPYSMFIAKNELYNEYCEFIFPILFEMERRMKPHNYSRQKRAIGYFGEFSLGLFIQCKHLRIKEVPLEMCGKIIKDRPYSLFNLYQITLQRLWDFPLVFSKEQKDLIVPDAVKVGFKQDGITLKYLN